MLVFFFISWWRQHEVLWGLTAVFSAILMINSYNVETHVYKYNNTLQYYVPVLTSNSYPYLMGINLAFFMLAIVYFIYDLWDKYGGKYAEEHEIKDVKP